MHLGTDVAPPGRRARRAHARSRLAALLPGLGGLVAETGSVLSHLAILAREYGVPRRRPARRDGALRRRHVGASSTAPPARCPPWPTRAVRHEHRPPAGCRVGRDGRRRLRRLRLPVPLGVEPGHRRRASSSSPPRSPSSAGPHPRPRPQRPSTGPLDRPAADHDERVLRRSGTTPRSRRTLRLARGQADRTCLYRCCSAPASCSRGWPGCSTAWPGYSRPFDGGGRPAGAAHRSRPAASSGRADRPVPAAMTRRRRRGRRGGAGLTRRRAG